MTSLGFLYIFEKFESNDALVPAYNNYYALASLICTIYSIVLFLSIWRVVLIIILNTHLQSVFNLFVFGCVVYTYLVYLGIETALQ